MMFSEELKELRGGKITWLHLSDIHLGSESNNDYAFKNIKRSLYNFLRTLKAKPDMIFFTGDLSIIVICIN
jgi:UDP-2,3-diacylglucosamine pyrophosphatase LpxH